MTDNMKEPERKGGNVYDQGTDQKEYYITMSFRIRRLIFLLERRMGVTPEIVVALCSCAGTLIGSIAGIMTANKLTSYRIEQLEKKVEKHNNLVERMAIVEQSTKSAHHRIDEIVEENHEKN